MKKTLFFTLFSAVLIINSCKEKDPEVYPQEKTGNINVEVSYLVNGQPAEFGKMKYVTTEGDSFQVDMINHFVSNFSFHNKKGGWTTPGYYQLVRHNDSLTRFFQLNKIPYGEYDSVRLFIGLDTHANHSLEMAAQLDPGYSMIWSWNTGYIFYMFEGKFINSNGNSVGFAYHIGGDNYRMEYSLPINRGFTVYEGKTTENMKIKLDLGEIFKSPNPIDLNTVPLVSHTFDHPDLTKDLTDNLLDAIIIE